MKVRELVNLFVGWCGEHLAPRTAEFYSQTLAPMLRAAGDLDVAEVRPYHLLAERQTWHRVLASQRLFRWALDQGIAAANPFAAVRRPRPRWRRGVLSRQDLARLMRKSYRQFRRVLLTARESAARPQELKVLAWEQVQLPEGMGWQAGLVSGQACFVLDEFKGRARRRDPHATRIIPISKRLGRLLWRLRGPGDAHGLVLTNSFGQAWTTNTLRCAMRRLRGRVTLSSAMHAEPLVLYTLRHTAATAWAAAGMPTHTLQAFLGHSTIKMTQRYVHFSRASLMEVWLRWQEKKKAQ